MKVLSPFVSTIDNEIEVGKKYQYKESLPSVIFEFKVLEDLSDDKTWNFKYEVTGVLPGADYGIQVGAISNLVFIKDFHGFFPGMFMILDEGSYALC